MALTRGIVYYGKRGRGAGRYGWVLKEERAGNQRLLYRFRNGTAHVLPFVQKDADTSGTGTVPTANGDECPLAHHLVAEQRERQSRAAECQRLYDTERGTCHPSNDGSYVIPGTYSARAIRSRSLELQVGGWEGLKTRATLLRNKRTRLSIRSPPNRFQNRSLSSSGKCP